MSTSHRLPGALSIAPTLTRPALATAERHGRLLRPGQELASAESLLRYRIERPVGEGGFGQVYLARRLGRSTAVPKRVCIKVSRRIDGWLREAY